MRPPIVHFAIHRPIGRLLGESLPNQLLAKLDRRKRAQPQEVHLEQAHLFARGPVPLRHDVIAAGCLAEWNDVFERLGGDHDSSAVSYTHLTLPTSDLV